MAILHYIYTIHTYVDVRALIKSSKIFLQIKQNQKCLYEIPLVLHYKNVIYINFNNK